MIDHRGYLLGTAAVCALVASTVAASAGGFAVRQQSVSGLGSAYAGSAAGGDLSSMYWNPAAVTVKKGPGLNSESHYSLMAPNAEVTVNTSSNPAFLASGRESGDITSLALASGSYYSYQFQNFDPNFFLGFSFNSPFGLKTKPENTKYAGSLIGRESSLKTFNLAPTLGYQISPTLSVGVGAQLQYATARFTFATGQPAGGDTRYEGNGVSVGWTAGLLWQPTAGTSIGLGYRSAISQEIDGAYINTANSLPAVLGGAMRSTSATSTIELPDMVTLSVRQSLTSNVRMLGTVEWTNWGVLKDLRVTQTGSSAVVTAAGIAATPGTLLARLPVGWTDGWFFSLGAEYDVSRQLTVRAGGAYEITPIENPTQRLVGIPDNDRIWASIGATYKWSETMSFDIAYSHVFVKDSTFDRTSLTGVRMTGDISASLDIIGVSIKSKW